MFLSFIFPYIFIPVEAHIEKKKYERRQLQELREYKQRLEAKVVRSQDRPQEDDNWHRQEPPYEDEEEPNRSCQCGFGPNTQNEIYFHLIEWSDTDEELTWVLTSA